MPRTLLLAAILLVPAAASDAGDWWKFGCHHSDCHCCPQGENKETREFWAEGGKLICIPGFRCPWWDCHAPVCGRVRHVKVLKRCECEVPGCTWNWDIECRPCPPADHHNTTSDPAAIDGAEQEEAEEVPADEDVEAAPVDAEPALPPRAPGVEARALPLNSPLMR